MGSSPVDIYSSYTAAGSPSGESLDDMMVWLDSQGAQREGPRNRVEG